jgi:hypothetical protein
MTFRTSNPPDAVAARLGEMIAPRWSWLRQPPEPFRGRIQGTHLKVMRAFRGTNSFVPVVVADIVQGPSGTEVRVTMRLHAFVAVFSVI